MVTSGEYVLACQEALAESAPELIAEAKERFFDSLTTLDLSDELCDAALLEAVKRRATAAEIGALVQSLVDGYCQRMAEREVYA